MRPHAIVAFVCAAAATFAAWGADIYVWTDESGKTHLADSVPPRYRHSAVRIDSSQFELSPEQQRDAAAARLAIEKKAAASAPPARASRAAPPRTAGPLSALPASAPPTVNSNECAALQREYRESLECFAPFMNANGSLKPGAFAACKSVVNPTLKCGSPPAY
jgi:hypothetical protein